MSGFILNIGQVPNKTIPRRAEQMKVAAGHFSEERKLLKFLMYSKALAHIFIVNYDEPFIIPLNFKGTNVRCTS